MATAQAQSSSLSIVDSHQHLWNPNRFSYSWMHSLPALNRRHLLEEYEAGGTPQALPFTFSIGMNREDR